MIDINASDFFEKFDPKLGTVGVVGHGYVGHAVEVFFHQHWNPKIQGYDKLFNVLINDKAKAELNTLDEVVAGSEAIFVCVPTPMNKDGSCHTGIVESVLVDIVTSAQKQERSLETFVVVMKSTVPPGFTDRMKKHHPGLRLIFSPEFLTEKNSIDDFESCNRIIMGGDEADGKVLFKYYEARIYERLMEKRTLYAICTPKTAEMVKLFANGILMTKVLFANEIYKLCEKLDIDFEEVRVIACLDDRIGVSHTSVPGHDGKLGAGGSCFPKDINSLRAVAREFGIPERLFTAVIERNEDLRPEKDWEQLKGRVVLDE